MFIPTVIALDLGGTRSKVVVLSVAGLPTIAPTNNGEWYTPTVIHCDRMGHVTFGLEAFERGQLEPEGLILDIKAKAGTHDNLLSNGQTMLAVDAIEVLLHAMVCDAERVLNAKPTHCVLTYPPCFRDDQKADLRAAAERLGLKVLLLLPESSAVAYLFATTRLGSKCHYLVADIGGLTVDVSVVSIERRDVRILATESRAGIAGNAFSDALLRRVLDEVEARCGKRPSLPDDAAFLYDLRQRVEQAKASLGTRADVLVHISWEGQHFTVTVQQTAYHADTADLIQSIEDIVQKTLAAAALDPQQLQHLIITGGGSHDPRIGAQLEARLGIAARTDVDPDRAVAYGALERGIEILRESGEASAAGMRILAAPRPKLTDVMAHDVGVSTRECGSDGHILSVLVRKNTPIPRRHSDSFFLEYEDQACARIEILEGEADAPQEQCLLIGEMELDNLPKEPQRTRRIVVEIYIDENGMVTAAATDKVGGQSQTVSFDYKHGVTADESDPASAA